MNSLSLKKLDLVSITLMTVGETYYDESIQNEEFMKVHPLIYKVTDFDFENDRILYNGQEELRLGIELHDKMEEQGIRI